MFKTIVFLILILSAAFTPAFTDGCVVYDYAMESYMHMEREQFCFINHQNGNQRMLLAVSLDELNGKNAVWIVPVPGKPENVKIDIFNQFPRLWGNDIKEHYLENFWICLTPHLSILALPQLAGSIDSSVHDIITKYGITSELVSANSLEELAAHISENKRTLPEAARTALQHYMGKEYCFVVSWISEPENLPKIDEYDHWTQNTTGIYIDFPTQKPFFPLIPTSAYGEKFIPANIYISGLQRPENLNSLADIQYFYAKENDFPQNLEKLFTGFKLTPTIYENYYNSEKISGFTVKNFFYTKISFNTTAKNYSEDIRIIPVSFWQKSLLHYMAYNKDRFRDPVILLIFLSVFSCVVSSLIVFKKNSAPVSRLIIAGIWNCLIFPAFCISALLLDLDSAADTSKTRPYLIKYIKTIGISILIFIFALIPSVITNSSANEINKSIIIFSVLFTFIFTLFSPLWHFYFHRRQLFLFTVLFTAIYYTALISLVIAYNKFL